MLVIGNGGSLGTGAIANFGTLRINRTDTSTFANDVTGCGPVEHNGTGTTTFTANKTYTGPTNINAGTVVIQDETSLGNSRRRASPSPAAPPSTSPPASPRNGIDFGAKQFTVGGTGVGGNGAIVNHGGLNQINAFEIVTLTADTLVNTNGTGTTQRPLRLPPHRRRGRRRHRRLRAERLHADQDRRRVSSASSTSRSALATSSSTKASSPSSSRTRIPDNGGTITYNNGTTAQWFNNAELADQSRPMIFNGSVSTGNADNDPAHIDANMTINGTLNHITLANQNATQTTLAGNLTGPGALTKAGGNLLILAGTPTPTPAARPSTAAR